MAKTHGIDETWRTLMISACAGDQAAYRQLLQAMTRLLCAYLRPRLHDSAILDDVVQEVLIAVHKAKHTFDPAQPLAPWFFAITHYKLNDYYRKNARQRRLKQDIAEQAQVMGSTVLPDEDPTAAKQVLELLAQLPEKQRRALELLKLEGLPAQEAADRLGLSLGALRVTAHRGYKNLLDRLRTRDGV